MNTQIRAALRTVFDPANFILILSIIAVLAIALGWVFDILNPAANVVEIVTVPTVITAAILAGIISTAAITYYAFSKS